MRLLPVLHVWLAISTCVAPAGVESSTSNGPISFRDELLAALSKHGCSAGMCHGFPDQQEWLSAFTGSFDPVAD